MDINLFNDEYSLVAQFEDGRFFVYGYWHGFSRDEETDELVIGKTKELKNALHSSYEWQLTKALNEVGNQEKVTYRKVKKEYKLVD